MTLQKITFLVSMNGLGHFKRCLGLIYHIIQKKRNVHIDVVCQEWQMKRLKGWYKFDYLDLHENVSFHTSIMTDSIVWKERADDYNYENLLSWSSSLDHPIITKSDVLISDNLVEALEYKHDAILMGSFLWFDVLEAQYAEYPLIQKMIENNKQLLAKYRPFMLCVNDVKMPAVEAYTRAVPVSWFGQDKSINTVSNNQKKRIAILTGASEVAQKLRSQLLNSIESNLDIDVAIPKSELLRLNNESDFIPFEFEVEDFEKCDLVICRPGVGTITDCLCTSTPMITFSEANNKEMAYNAQCLDSLGVSTNLGSNPSTTQVTQAIQKCLSQNEHSRMSNNISQIKTDGFEMAFNWLTQNNYIN